MVVLGRSNDCNVYGIIGDSSVLLASMIIITIPWNSDPQPLLTGDLTCPTPTPNEENELRVIPSSDWRNFVMNSVNMAE